MNKTSSNEITLFDFRNTYFLSHDSLHSIQILHENFTQLAIENIASLLHYTPKITLDNIKQDPFSLFLKSCSASSFHTLIDINPLFGYGLITMNIELCYGIIEEMLGGNREKPVLCRSLNELELAIQRKFINILLDALKKAWKSYLNTNFSISELDVNPKKETFISPITKCIILDFTYTFETLTTFFSIVLPCQCLREFENLLAQAPASPLIDKINSSSLNLEIKALLGSLEISFSELKAMQMNDILILDANINKPLSVLVQGQPALRGVPGLLQKQKGIMLF